MNLKRQIMKTKMPIERIDSGVKNFDKLLGGGLPKGSVTLICGTPGSGKTTLAQQICFLNSNLKSKALIFQTLSEPSAKTIKYMSQFEFFKSAKVGNTVEYVDLGTTLRSKGLPATTAKMMNHIKRVKPSFVTIDSFKVFDDLSDGRDHLRKFTYEVAIQLMAWEITGFLLGEYGISHIENSPLASVVDGIISMTHEESNHKVRRLMRVMKMRGTHHDLDPHEFKINDAGIELIDQSVR
jgi:circadian clock protein KaiC